MINAMQSKSEAAQELNKRCFIVHVTQTVTKIRKTASIEAAKD